MEAVTAVHNADVQMFDSSSVRVHQHAANTKEGTIVLADKAYDADWLRRSIEVAGAAPNIPSKSASGSGVMSP